MRDEESLGMREQGRERWEWMDGWREEEHRRRRDLAVPVMDEL